MTAEPTARSRRALLAGAFGGAVGLAALALGRPLPARAADGDPLELGSAANAATSTTKLSNTTDTDDVLWLASTSGRALKATTGAATGRAAALGQAAAGAVGVMGVSGGLPAVGSKIGVLGYANQDATAIGVQGRSVMGYGVRGTSTDGYGVYGSSATNVGVIGTSTSDPGVYGSSTEGSGVRGVSANSIGVSGESAADVGILGDTATGIGVLARASGSGAALQVSGRPVFSTSGFGTIPSGARSVVVPMNPAIDLTASSKVLVTLMANPGGSTAVQRVAVSTAANSITVYLTANASAATKFAWFVLG